MRLLVVLLMFLCCWVSVLGYEDTTLEDDDFAEFEQFDSDEDDIPASKNSFGNEDIKINSHKAKRANEFEENGEIEDEIIVEDDEDNEFEHFQDPEEFEGFQDSPPPRTSEQPKITITKVPLLLRARWDAYWLEGILCCALAAYALSYAIGRAKNTAIASTFLKLHAPLLNENFALVGETGADVVCADGERGWQREAEHSFTLWCSGRVCCEGMLLTLKLIKRQDLVHVLLGAVKPTTDTLLVRVELGKDDSDPFVLCVAQKKVAARLAKEMHDLSVFCPERRAGDKHGLPAALAVMAETPEAAGGLLDARVAAALQLYADHVQYIHISDRYCGPKNQEETTTSKPPETERVLLASFSLGPEGGGDEVRPLLQLVFYLLDKVKRLRLSKEALAKCEKRRQKVAEAWLRGAHAARQEQAAQRREEKRKQEKERILAEDDPEKQRRWELKEQKRQQKRKTPKMKQLKVKAL